MITKEDVEKKFAEMDQTYKAFVAENPPPDGQRWMLHGEGKLDLFPVVSNRDFCGCDDDSCSG